MAILSQKSKNAQIKVGSFILLCSQYGDTFPKGGNNKIKAIVGAHILAKRGKKWFWSISEIERLSPFRYDALMTSIRVLLDVRTQNNQLINNAN